MHSLHLQPPAAPATTKRIATGAWKRGRGQITVWCWCWSRSRGRSGRPGAPHASLLHPLSKITAHAGQGKFPIEDGKTRRTRFQRRARPTCAHARWWRPPPHGPSRSRSQKRNCQFPAPARRARLGRGLNRLSSVSTLTRADPLVDPGLRGRWETREGGLDG